MTGAIVSVISVLPPVGYRQRLLSLSGPLAVRLGCDRELLAVVSELLARAALQDMRRSVKREHGLGRSAPWGDHHGRWQPRDRCTHRNGRSDPLR